ncbi:putative membrane protein [Streptohalobacillus salinus]|uniref:Putative membrane protein n=1 Tax=Streptohalobacillus salinus TaxID=621096 RepID=A0A2V3W2A6_9BACI|nr:YibE/F family protein [Streptohalobacillus salinus]PXW87324.1 putative membrane protein [Streptohalobacillus salinus]
MYPFKAMRRRPLSMLIAMVVLAWAGIYLMLNSPSFYDEPLAVIINQTQLDQEVITDETESVDTIYRNEINVRLLNTAFKGEQLTLMYQYSDSKVYHDALAVGDEVFISLRETAEGLSGEVVDEKRDQPVLFLLVAFLLVMIVIGRKEGLFAMVSLALNTAIMAMLIWYFVANEGSSLLALMGIAVILMTVTSLFFVSGITYKTWASVCATLLGTGVMLLISLIVLDATHHAGLRFEEMGFLTRHPEAVFTAGILVGALGAVMDVAVTINSSLFSLYQQDPTISYRQLRKAGQAIGEDIMGTMTNIIFFAYISGTIPTLLIYLLNDAPLGFVLEMNLSLELVRALSGGIGIVLSIPISLSVSLLFIRFMRKKQSATAHEEVNTWTH